MNSTNSFLPIVFVIIYVVIIFFGGVFISRVFKKYSQGITMMKKNGSYDEWTRRNKAFLFSVRLFDYAAILCLISFVFFSITKISSDVAVIIKLVIPFLFLSTASRLILYLRLPKNQV